MLHVSLIYLWFLDPNVSKCWQMTISYMSGKKNDMLMERYGFSSSMVFTLLNHFLVYVFYHALSNLFQLSHSSRDEIRKSILMMD